VHAYFASLDKSDSTLVTVPPPSSSGPPSQDKENAAAPGAAADEEVTKRNTKGNVYSLNFDHKKEQLNRAACAPLLPRGASMYECAPSFVILGAQKAATTSLFGYLGQHPQVALPRDKELNFLG